MDFLLDIIFLVSNSLLISPVHKTKINIHVKRKKENRKVYKLGL